MSQYYATVEWARDNADFLSRKYSRAHQWHFDGGVTVPASSSPHIVPVPLSVEDNVDPEEAFVASLSSCHMLFFLDFAARTGWVINHYRDQAIGTLEKNAEGKLAMTEVVLKPHVEFDGKQPTRQQVSQLHHQAHEACFIANSVLTEVRIEI